MFIRILWIIVLVWILALILAQLLLLLVVRIERLRGGDWTTRVKSGAGGSLLTLVFMLALPVIVPFVLVRGYYRWHRAHQILAHLLLHGVRIVSVRREGER